MRGYNKTIVCMIVLGMMMIPFGYTASAEETTLQGGIQTVHLNLKTKPDFSPETTTEEAKEEQPPTAYTSEMADLFRTKEWTEIGTWEADGVQYDTAYEGSAKFNIWWVQDPNDSDDYYADVQYRWTLMLDGQDIAHFEDENEHNCEQGRGNPCEWTASTGFNTTEPFVAGQVLSVKVEYAAYAKIYIYYDNATFDSGVSFDADAIYFGGGTYNSNQVSFDIVEAWSTNLNTAVDEYFVYIVVDSVTQANDGVTIGSGAEYDVGNSQITGQKITWPIGVNSAPSVTFSYSTNESDTASTLINLGAGTGGGAGDEESGGGMLGIPGFSTVLAIVSVGLIASLKRRV